MKPLLTILEDIDSLEVGSKVTFLVDDKSIEYEICEVQRVFAHFSCGLNGALFTKLRIDKYDYLERNGFPWFGGDWPETENILEFRRLLKCLSRDFGPQTEIFKPDNVVRLKFPVEKGERYELTILDKMASFLKSRDQFKVRCISGSGNLHLRDDELDYGYPPSIFTHINQPIFNQLTNKSNGNNEIELQGAQSAVRVGSVPEGRRVCGRESKATVESRQVGYRTVVG